MSVIHNLVNAYSRRRFALLFFSLLSTMVAAPVLGELGISTKFMEVFLALNMLAAVLVTVFGSKRHAVLGLLVLLAVRVSGTLVGYEPLVVTSQAVGVLICLISAVIMLRYTLSEGFVTSERIYAALSVYLLIGIMCGLIFCIIMEQWPSSFSFQGSSFVGGKKNVLAATIYFSFVTLGTLGYGDIIPVSGPARALAVTEAIFGQMYLVVVVARLVSLYKGRSDRESLLTPIPCQHKDLVRTDKPD